MTDADDWGVRMPVLVFEKFVVFSDGLEDTVVVVNKLVDEVCDGTVSLTLRPANKDDPPAAAEELSWGTNMLASVNDDNQSTYTVSK